ncbi:MAG TPA: hypothetical protein VLT47_12770 [Anaeromyxobacteraceae bacterium]|nr:hypothetical protein [Anaeromyxobacteraceae bacterium]
MRPTLLAVLAALTLLPVAASAKAWQGITPGTSTIEGVVNKFGEPTSRAKRGVRTVLAYLGEQALPGTKQAQFHAREDGVVVEITVFLATQLEKEAIEGTYGRSPRKTFTDDFLPVWLYEAEGVTVYFTKDGFVNAISFSAGRGAAKQPAAAPPAKRGAAAGARSDVLP